MKATGWDTEWAATKASEAMRYLATNYPEASGSEALHPHQDTAHQDTAHGAAVNGDEAAYLEALRQYMRAGWSVALGIRKGAA